MLGDNEGNPRKVSRKLPWPSGSSNWNQKPEGSGRDVVGNERFPYHTENRLERLWRTWEKIIYTYRIIRIL